MKSRPCQPCKFSAAWCSVKLRGQKGKGKKENSMQLLTMDFAVPSLDEISPAGLYAEHLTCSAEHADVRPASTAWCHRDYVGCAWQAVMKEIQTLLETFGSVYFMLPPDMGWLFTGSVFSSAIFEAQPRRIQTTFFSVQLLLECMGRQPDQN